MGTVHLHPRSAQPRPTLASFAEEVDETRYRCPAVLAHRCDRLLADDSSLRILAVTGPGGSGKSAALREVGRRARRTGWGVVLLDARTQDVLAAVDGLAAGAGHARQVVLVDEVDRLGPEATAFGTALAGLPGDTRVVAAGRELAPRWLPAVLEPVADRVRLAPLGADEADAVLRSLGVGDAGARAGLGRWAGGLPLALVVGARAWLAAPDDARGPAGGSVGGLVGEALLRESGGDLLGQLAGSALDRLDPELLALLVIAPGVDPALLGEFCPGRVPEVVAALRDTGVVDVAGGRLLLHPALAEMLAERLRAEDPARAAATTLRIAGHEHARAVAGDPGALARLATLVRDPELRAGLGPASRAGHYVDRWRPEDAAPVRAGLERVLPGSWEVVRPWAGPDLRVVRRADGAPVAVVAALPMAAACGVTGLRARLVAPLVERARGGDGDAADRTVVSALQVTFDDLGDPEVDRLRNAAGLAQCGLANPRGDWVNVLGDRAGEHAVLRAYGYSEVPDLARTVAGVRVTTWVADAGPGGLAGLLHAAVVAEQRRGDDALVAPDRLLAALESFHDDGDLAGLAVVPAGGPAVGAEEVRAWVRDRVDEVLGGEPALLDLVTRRYLVRGATHDEVLRSTYLSRATYFRRLRRARDLLGAGAATDTI